MKTRRVGLVGIFAASTAAADSATLVAADSASAIDAATHGHCEKAHELGARVRELDATYYANTLAKDASFARCVDPPPVASPRVRGGSPPLSAGRVAGELLAGFATAVGGAFVGGALGLELGTDTRYVLQRMILGGMVGMVVAYPIGIHLVGRIGDQHGSYTAGLIGTAVPAAVGFGLFLAAAYTQSEPLLVGAIVVGVGGSAVGGLVAYNWSRRYDVAPVVTTSRDAMIFGLASRF